MDRLNESVFTARMTETLLNTREAAMAGASQDHDQSASMDGSPANSNGRSLDLDLDKVTKAIAKRSFCTLATVSSADRPHNAGVLYEMAGTGPITLFVSTLRTSRKARNIAANPNVGVFVPIRRLPVGPPSAVQFQATAEILPVDDPGIMRLVEAGELKGITSHGELDLTDACLLRIQPVRRINTYGLGMSLRRLLRDPLNAGGHLDLTA